MLDLVKVVVVVVNLFTVILSNNDHSAELIKCMVIKMQDNQNEFNLGFKFSMHEQSYP